MDNKKLIEILRKGILEVRILSAKEDVDKHRINKMSNILHNIPDALDNDQSFDYELLNSELKGYRQEYADSLFNTKVSE